VFVHSDRLARYLHPQLHLVRLLLLLEVVEQDTSLLRLLTPIPYNDARAVNNLSGIALTVEYAETGPFTEHLSIGDLDQRDLVLGAQRNDELLVGFLFAGLVEDAHVGLSAVERLAGFTETAGETVVDECELENTCRPSLERFIDVNERRA